MNSVNIVVLTGRLGKDPEFRPVGDNEVATIVMATDHSWYDKNKANDDGTIKGWRQKTSWHKCVVWRPGKSLKEAKKGQMVHVQGRYEDNNWTDKEGIVHYQKEVVVEKHWVLPKSEGKPFQDPTIKEYSAPVSDQGPPENDAPFPDGDEFNDLPF
jgi:single stranded DNA-binding protein